MRGSPPHGGRGATAGRRDPREVGVARRACTWAACDACLPVLRGVIVLWETLALGMRALVFSSEVAAGMTEEEEEEPSFGVHLGACWG